MTQEADQKLIYRGKEMMITERKNHSLNLEEIQKIKKNMIALTIERINFTKNLQETTLLKILVSFISYYFIEQTCLYLSNLGTRINPDHFDELLKKFGNVKNVNIIKHPHTGECRGFAFVSYETKEHTTAALQGLNGLEYEGKKIVAEISKRSKGRASTPGMYLGPSNAKKSRYGQSFRPRYRSRSDSRRKYRYDDRERRPYREQRYQRDYREGRDTRDTRDYKETKDYRDSRDYREPRHNYRERSNDYRNRSRSYEERRRY